MKTKTKQYLQMYLLRIQWCCDLANGQKHGKYDHANSECYTTTVFTKMF